MRTTPEEHAQLGQRLAAKRGGPPAAIAPRAAARHLAIAGEGGPFFDPAADVALLRGPPRDARAGGRGARGRRAHQRRRPSPSPWRRGWVAVLSGRCTVNRDDGARRLRQTLADGCVIVGAGAGNWPTGPCPPRRRRSRRRPPGSAAAAAAPRSPFTVPSQELVEPRRHGDGECGVVDVRVHLVHLDRRGERLAQPASSAASAAASKKGPPSPAIAEMPRSGTNSATGPVAADSLAPSRRPSSAHSSGVVRISVTFGLCT